MNVKQSFKLALKSIKGSKFRSFLTMLGIIIGVASVIVLVSLIDGFSQDMASSFESMGTNLLTVSIRGRGGNLKVDAADMMEFAEETGASICVEEFDGKTNTFTKKVSMIFDKCRKNYYNSSRKELVGGSFWEKIEY